MFKKLFCLVICAVVFSCTEDSVVPASDSAGAIITPNLSYEKDILSFKFNVDEEILDVEIRNDSILAVLPSSVDLENLIPIITVSDKASVNPSSGETVDFTYQRTFEVTAEDYSKKIYTAIITKINADNRIYSVQFDNQAEGQAQSKYFNSNPADIDTIVRYVPYLSPIKELISNISLPKNATIEPSSGIALDYSNPVTYTVTAENGDIKEYLVIVDNPLPALKLNGVLGNDYRNIPPAESISFYAKGLNPIPDSLKVFLLPRNGLEEILLEVQEVNYDKDEVVVKLPNTYDNNSYQFKVYNEHDSFEISDGFTLDAGTPSIKTVNDDYVPDDSDLKYERLLAQGEIFYADVYVNRVDFDSHEFYLRKNGQDYQFTSVGHSVNFEKVRFEMPALKDIDVDSGFDFQFVIKYLGQEFVFPILNSANEPIEVIVPKAAVVSSISSTSIVRGEDLIVYGEYLSYPHTGSFLVNGRSTISMFSQPYGFGFQIGSEDINEDGSVVFDTSNFQSGTYDLFFTNGIYKEDRNVKGGPRDTGYELTVNFPESTHPSLEVTSAKIYKQNADFAAGQVSVSFNGNIENMDIKRIELTSGSYISNLVIQNYFTYPSSVLTGRLSEEVTSDYRFYSAPKDGFVVLEDNGVEYTLWFKLETAN